MPRFKIKRSDSDQQYDEIQEIPNKDWLQPSAVSLAKLDQVRAKVYNLGAADPQQLKPTSNNLLPKPSDTSSMLSSQRHAWGSNSSIPNLMRQQNEKQKYVKQRPESAKVANNKKRPLSAVKTRPQSAKEGQKITLGIASACDLNEDIAGKKNSLGISVKGAHYNANERPPEGIRRGTAPVGWVAPHGGIYELSTTDIDDALTTVQNEQNGHAPPQPPRSSPDFLGMLDEGKNADTDRKDADDVVDELLGNSSKKKGKKKGTAAAPRPPPGPIHFTLPKADMEPDPGDSLELANGEHEGLNYEDLVDDIIERHTASARSLTSTATGQSTATSLQTDRASRGSIGSIEIDITLDSDEDELSEEDEMIDLDKIDEELEKYENKRQKEKDESAPNRETHRVQFAEELNQTLSITPRGCRPLSGKARSFSARAELQRRKRVIPGADSDGSDSEAAAPMELTGVSATAHKPQSQSMSAIQGKTKAPVATCTVNIVQDKATPARQRRFKTKDGDIETMMSQIVLSDDELELASGSVHSGFSDSETNLVNATTKQVSSSTDSKNYYELAVGSGSTVDDMEGAATKKKTIKTFEFDTTGLKENKVVSELDGAQPATRAAYVAPRPRPASGSSRPTSATKPQKEAPVQRPKIDYLSQMKKDRKMKDRHKKDAIREKKKAEAEEELKRKRKPGKPNFVIIDETKQEEKENKEQTGMEMDVTAVSELGDEALSEDEGETSEKETEDRKDRRVSEFSLFPEEPTEPEESGASGQASPRSPKSPRRSARDSARSPRAKTPRSARKKRVKSAILRPRSSNHANKSKQSSRSTASGSEKESKYPEVSDKPKPIEIRRNNIAVKAMELGGQDPIEFDYASAYAQMKNQPPPPVGSALKKYQAELAKQPEVVHMWTRRTHNEYETAGLKDCRELQEKLIESGIPVTLKTLSRGLLPPSQYCFNEYSIATVNPQPFPQNTAGLLSKPAFWLPREFRRVQAAKKLVKRATESLWEQEMEERRIQLAQELEEKAALAAAKEKAKKKKGRRKGSAKKRPASAKT